MDNIRLLRLEDNNGELFIGALEEELLKVFDVGNVDDLPENYGDSERWSLIRMIKEKRIDSYQIIYVNDLFWIGSGGVIRVLGPDKVYQAGFRAFSKTRSVNVGLGSKNYSHEYNTRYQIERARINNCRAILFSFNEYNKRLFDITHKYHLPRVFGPGVFVPSSEPIFFNGVKQWLITMSLK